jgi:hypothetical protein
MRPKGIENVETIMEACKNTVESLGSEGDSNWKEWLTGAVDVLEQMKGKFFLKTNLAVPPTNTCRKTAENLLQIAGSGNLAEFPQAFEDFQGSMEVLLKRASMDGITIT